MKSNRRPILRSLALLLCAPFFATTPSHGVDLPEGFHRLDIEVEGVAREALVYAPATAREKPAPLVFVFHGHGGRMVNAARTFAMHRHWPEAISVYMQGLNTPGKLTDPEGKKPGWQNRPGILEDRDLKFFDALLAKLKADYQVDEKRIYSTGHSNGGGFTYLLWSQRGDVLAAVAPSSAASARSPRAAAFFKPKPVMHIAGETDALVKYEWQQASMEAIRRINGCESEGTKWDEHCLIYASEQGTPFVSFIHPGGHKFHKDAPALIVKFFKQHATPE